MRALPRLALLSLTLLASQALAQSCNQNLQTLTQPPVEAFITESALLTNGDIVVSGSFTQIQGIPANAIARWDGSTWHSLGSGFTAGNPIVLKAHPQGGFIAAGTFTAVDGVPANRIARWNGSWTPLGSGLAAAPGDVTIAPNGTLYAIESASAQVRVWNDTTWSILPITLQDNQGGVPSIHQIIALPNNDLVVAGRFTSINSVPATNAARWNGSTWTAMGTAPELILSSAYIAIAADANNVYLALTQNFGFPNDTSVYQWNGSTWSILPTGISRPTDLQVTPDGRVIASHNSIYYPPYPVSGDYFFEYRYISAWENGVHSYIACDRHRFSVSGANLNYSLMPLPDGDILAFGSFGSMNTLPIERIARYTNNTWQPFASRGTAPNMPVSALATLPDGRVMAGGNFSGLGNARAQRLGIFDGAAWNIIPGTGLFAPTPLESGAQPSSRVRVLKTQPDGSVLAGGEGYDTVRHWNGTNWLSVSLPSSERLGYYNPALFSLDPGIIEDILTLPDGSIVAAGSFSPGFFPQDSNFNNVARLVNGEWTNMGLGLKRNSSLYQQRSFVYALETLSNGDMIAAGAFNFTGTTPLTNIARWTGSDWVPFAGGITGTGDTAVVRDLLRLPNGDLLAAGNFTTAGTTPANNIARWDGTTWSPLGPGTNGQINVLHLEPDGTILAGGSFTTAGGAPALRIARWNGSTWSQVGPGISSGEVEAITMRPSGDIVLAGTFVNATAPFFTIITPCPTCDTIDFNNDGLFPDTQDITDFLAVFAGAPCPTATCNDIDFNNDSLFPDTLDIQTFLSVFSGAPCF
jgi:trimeric autotransporter adhesin